MSESIRPLLVRGIAAAKANERDEARFYLEWVLREIEAGDEQKVSAWLWLSQISDQPEQRRECLENALALDPTNALARRGLALLNQPATTDAPVHDPFQPDLPIRPADAPQPPSVRRYVCPKCGGKMAFAAQSRKLICTYCGHQLWEYQAIQSGALAHEQDFAATLPMTKAHRWELPVERRLACQSCGATVTLAPAQMTGACLFCGSAYSVAPAEDRDLIAPEAVIPFQFDVAAATKHIHSWLEKQRFRPGDLDEEAALSPPRGVYLPFWTFDVSGEVTWRGWVWEGSGRNGRWVPRNGNYLAYHNDLLIPASHSLPHDLLNAVANFDPKAMVAYSADALADWPTEIYQVSMADASLVARRRALDEAKEHVHYRSLGGERVRDLSFSSAGLVVESFKLALLPVWISRYRYKGESYRLFVNGQSGEVAGRVPRSGVQKLLADIFGKG